MSTKRNDNREAREAEAERRRNLEGNTLFENLGEPIQKLLMQVAKDITSDEMKVLSKVTVRQLAKVYDMLAVEEDPDKILAWLKREINKGKDADDSLKKRRKQQIDTGASRDAIKFYQELEKKNVEIMEKFKKQQEDRDQHRSSNIAERKKRRTEAQQRLAEERERAEKAGVKTDAVDKLKKTELADIMGTFDRFTAKQSNYDNSNATQDTEWWKKDDYRRDFEKNGRKGSAWTRVIEGGSQAIPDSEMAVREEWYRSQCWWKSDKFKREWAATKDAAWWKEETYIRDWQDHGEKGVMWTAADEISGFNKKGDRRRAAEIELKNRVEWYKNNGPKGIVKNWCALAEGSHDRCTLEEKREREDYFKNGDWWKSETLSRKLNDDPSSCDALFVGGAAGADREWWKDEKYRRDFQKGGKAFKAASEKAAVTGEDVQCSEAESKKREEWYADYWWKSQKFIDDYKQNGANGKLWKARSEKDSADSSPKSCKDSEAKLREAWFKSCDDRQWWKEEAAMRDWEENGAKGKKWTAAWAEAGKECSGDVHRAAPEELAAREDYFKKNWWKSEKYVKDFQINGKKGTAWKSSKKEANTDTDWWKQGEYQRQWAAQKKANFEAFWKTPEYVEDFFQNGEAGKKWLAANAAAGSISKGDQAKATPEEIAERKVFYAKNWWRQPEFQRDFAAHGKAGKKWMAGDESGNGKATPEELKERMEFYQPKWAQKCNPAYLGMFEIDGCEKPVMQPASPEEIHKREQYFKKNWWKNGALRKDFKEHGADSKLLKAATADVAALELGDDAQYQASPEEIAERKQWLESATEEEENQEWWQNEAYTKDFAADQEPEFWKNAEYIDDYLKNGANGKKWNAINAAAGSTGKGDKHKATPEQLKDREEWFAKNFWKSPECQKDFEKNGEKGTLWSSSQPNGKGTTVSEGELKSRMAWFKPTSKWQQAEKPASNEKVTNCGTSEAMNRNEWFEKNWWKNPDVKEDFEKHGKDSKYLKAATLEAAQLGLGDDPMYQASPEEIKERMEYFETQDDIEWWKNPNVVEDFVKHGKEGALWQSRNFKEGQGSMGKESPCSEEELQKRTEWFEKNMWKTPEALEDYQVNGNKGKIWMAAKAGADTPASDDELKMRGEWFESHRTVEGDEERLRKEWFETQLTDEEKIMRRDWMVKQQVECKKIHSDELSDVLAQLNDGDKPSEDQLKEIEEAVKRRRKELYGDEHPEEADPDAITQEEFITAVAETNFYVPQTDDERMRAEEEALEAMQSEEMARMEEEAAFLAMEAQEERERAGEEYVDEQAAEDEEAAFLDQMEDQNALQAAPNEDDVQYTQDDETAWEDFLNQQQGGDDELTDEQAAELERQEEERLQSEQQRADIDAAAWQSEEMGGDEGEEENGEPVEEDQKEELEALVQDDGEGWEGEEEEWEPEEGAEPVDEMLNEEKGQPMQWKLPLKEVINPQFLKSYFTVIKYTPSHSLLGGKQKRIWVVDHFTRCFYNLEKSGKIRKEHAANKLLQLERNLLDTTRLRLMFFDAAHSYELQFFSPAERERFYETASAIRPSIRVYSPDLTNQDASVEACTTTIDGVGPEAMTVTCNNAGGKPVQRELHGECKVNASKLLTEPLTIWVGTFNLSGHPPPRGANALDDWMPKDKYDLYAVAVQEASYRKEESEWFELVQAHLGKEYLTLASMNLWDTLLIVLTRKKHLLKITNVEGSTKATVHKSVCGTKGGIGISLRFLETSMCFVTCHLAARLERNAMRNTNMEEVVDCLQLGIRETDFVNQFNHVFFFGDFNYRLELDSAQAEQAINDKKYAQLLDYDQMTMQRRDEGILHGFQEPPVTFAPTYRMQVGTAKYMAEKGNAPSYCDRVVTRSMANTWVKCTGYKSIPTIQTSEHQPVHATFIVRCVRPVLSCFAKQQSPIPMFVFEEVNFVESTGPIMKKPCIKIETPFTGLMKQIEAKTTNTATPFWKGSEIPKLESVSQVQEYLETCHIILIVREGAEKRDDKAHRGTGLVTLFGRVIGVQDVQQEFESDVICHGKNVGKLVGKFHWEPAPLQS